jgi:mono/diheme cytochrome c family protein
MKRVLGLTLCILVSAAGTAGGQTMSPRKEPAQKERAQVQRGRLLLERGCSGCHAIGRAGLSPHSEAPPFRVLGQRYPIESLEEALGEGLMSGHPEMPEFRFSPSDVGAVIAYLKSVQVK